MSYEYESDFHNWLYYQANLLRNKLFSQLDTENLAEELEALAREEKRAIERYLKDLMLYSLRSSIKEKPFSSRYEEQVRQARTMLAMILEDSPSLREDILDSLNDAYTEARLEFLEESDLEEAEVPETCPWEFEDILQEST